MSALAWYPFYWADYSSKTMHLTQAQHGAYFLLLRWIYTTDSPIPHKQRFSIAQARLDHEKADTDAVLTQFFTRTRNHWHSKKADEIIAEAKLKHEKFVEAGRLGGKQRSSNAQATLQASLEPGSSNHNHTNNQKKDIKYLLSSGMGKNGNGTGHVTIKEPSERLERFKKKLAESFPENGWLIVIAASNPASPDYARCIALCKSKAQELGKGWPHQWPTEH
jgi:uncharacterized protein YdaU (DUF1376 family)